MTFNKLLTFGTNPISEQGDREGVEIGWGDDIKIGSIKGNICTPTPDAVCENGHTIVSIHV